MVHPTRPVHELLQVIPAKVDINGSLANSGNEVVLRLHRGVGGEVVGMVPSWRASADGFNPRKRAKVTEMRGRERERESEKCCG